MQGQIDVDLKIFTQIKFFQEHLMQAPITPQINTLKWKITRACKTNGDVERV